MREIKFVEIYEGDIVHIEGLWTRKVWPVVWSDDRWGLEYESESYDNGDQYRGDDIDWSETEIVGNIYENPHLLTHGDATE